MSSQSRRHVTRLLACLLSTLAAVLLVPSQSSAGCAGHLSAGADPFSSLVKLNVLSLAEANSLADHPPSSPVPCRGLSCSPRDSAPKPALPLKLLVRAEIWGAIPRETLLLTGFAGVSHVERDPARLSLRFSRIDRPPRFSS